MSKSRFLLSLLFVVTSILSASAQKPKVFDLWPNGCPTASENPQDTARVWLYLPKAEKSTGRSVVICPGGGYSHLAMNHRRRWRALPATRVASEIGRAHV